MKNCLRLFAVIIFAAGCGTAGTQISGNGNITTTHRDAANAVSVNISGSFRTEIERGEPGISITGDENLHQYIITEIKDGKLYVYQKYRTALFYKNPLTVKISMPQINEIRVNGSGPVSGSNSLFTAGSVGIYLTGSATINLTVSTSSLEANIDGSGRMTLVGHTGDLRSNISGSGQLLAEGMSCSNAVISISGSGKAKVSADRSLDAAIAGSGTVYYSGNPADIKKNISGSGKLVKM